MKEGHTRKSPEASGPNLPGLELLGMELCGVDDQVLARAGRCGRGNGSILLGVKAAIENQRLVGLRANSASKGQVGISHRDLKSYLFVVDFHVHRFVRIGVPGILR